MPETTEKKVSKPEPTSFSLDTDLKYRFKNACSRRRRTQTDVIRDLLEQWISLPDDPSAARTEVVKRQELSGKSTKTVGPGVVRPDDPVLHFNESRVAAEAIGTLKRAGRQVEVDSVLNLLQLLAGHKDDQTQVGLDQSSPVSGNGPGGESKIDSKESDRPGTIEADLELTRRLIRNATKPENDSGNRKRVHRGKTA